MRLQATCLLLIALALAPVRGASAQPATGAAPGDDAMTRALSKAAAAGPKAPAPAEAPVLRELSPGRAATLEAGALNRGAKLTVHTVVLRDAYGKAKPARDGARLLVLDTEWENIIPLTYIYEKQVPTEYRIPVLGDHVYVVVNGRIASRLRADADTLPGHVPVKDFRLERIGAVVRGNLVFDMPPEPLRSAELRYYDYAHGHMTVPLVVPADAAEPAEKPLSPPLKNEVLEVAAYSMQKADALGDRTAPAGMTFVTVDLRARSTFTVEADAEAFDPKARKGSKMKVGHVADWKESRKYLQLVADGEYGYLAEPQGELEEEPRFLPDVMTGGKVVFLAPAGAKSLELRCDFPNAKASTGGAAFRPKGITLALEGKRPARANAPAIASVDDDVYRVQVVGQQAAPEFAGQAAGEGKKFLVLDVTVHNNGRNGEFFQTPQQLKYAAETGEQLPLSPVAYQGVRRPTELVWVPSGEQRSFQAVFEIGANEMRPRLAFTGVSKAQVLNLKQLAATAVAARPPEGGNKAAPVPAPAKQPAKAPVEVAASAKPGNMAANPANPPAQVTTPAVKEPPAAPAQNIKPIRVAAKQPHQPKGLAGVGLTAEQVNTAIDRGAEGLWAHQRELMEKSRSPFGYNLGYDALVALALVHSNYHKKSPEFDAELRGMLDRIDPPALGTYGAGVLAMLVEAYGDGTYLPKMRQTVRCVIESQGIAGSWGYYVKAPPALLRDPSAEKVLQVRGGIPLEGEASSGEVVKRTVKWTADADGDNSTTQYALLGLWSASRSKVPVEPAAWERALAVTRERQCDDGGWYYHHKGSYSYGSMTCAGICSVALARHHLGEAAPAEDPAIERGLAWLVNNFSVAKHPAGADNYLYYYLYSLERVGRVLDTEFIGPHEWYPLGARFLLDKQQPDGNWKGFGDEERPVLASSFALLFLTRATATLNADQKRGGDGTLRTDVAAAPGHRVYIILDCSGTMMEEVDGVQRHKIARDAMAGLVSDMPETNQLALRVFGHRKAASQPGADEDTELLVPLGKLDRAKVAAGLTNLRARGKTPLARTLMAVANDVRGSASAERPTTVVLVTDGGDDNTRPPKSPLDAAGELADIPGVAFWVVGFDVDRPEWAQQLRGLARRGKGQYLSADDAKSLLPGLRAAVYRTPESFVVLDGRGRPIRKANFKESVTLPEGKYAITTDFAGLRYSEPFWINTDATTAVVFDAAKVGVDPSAGAAPADANAAAADAAPAPAPAPAAGKKKFCTNCGTPLTAAARFCTKCGAKAG